MGEIEVIIALLVGAFLIRTIAHMIIFVSSYGGLLWPFKTWTMQMLNKDLYNKIVTYEPKKISVGEKLAEILIDNFANRYKIIHLWSCVFCVGFWISVFAMMVLINYHIAFITLPILTYFFIEKI